VDLNKGTKPQYFSLARWAGNLNYRMESSDESEMSKPVFSGD